MNQWIAVDFARTRQENTGSATLGHSEHIDRAHHRCLDRLDGVELIMAWGCRAGHVIDLIHFQEDRQRHIVTNQLEIGLT